MAPKKASAAPLPFDGDQSAEVARLREEVAELTASNEQLGKELWRYRDQISRRDRDLREWEKRVVSGMRRSWEEDRTHVGYLFVEQQAAKARQEIDALIYQVKNLPEKPKPTDVATLRTWANLATQRLGGSSRGQAKAFYENVRAEVTRLRGYITEAAQKLHKELGAEIKGPTFTGCGCPGCDLIIGMDVLGDHEPAPEGDAAA